MNYCTDCGISIMYAAGSRLSRCAVCFDAYLEETIEERAAIMEHDAKLPKAQAEQLAAEDVRRVMFREGKAR